MRLPALFAALIVFATGCMFEPMIPDVSGGFVATDASGEWTLAPDSCVRSAPGPTLTATFPDDSVTPNVRLSAEFTGAVSLGTSNAVDFAAEDCDLLDVVLTLDDGDRFSDSIAKGHAYVHCVHGDATLSGHVDFENCEAP